VDIFATGVILFIMFTGIPPFGEAQPNDPYYKLLINKKYDYFWHAHSRNKPVGFFSTEFKDLIVAMLSPDPATRPSLQDIKGHAWYMTPTPTFEEVQDDMKKRYVKVQEGMDKERQEKKMMALKKKAAADAKKPGGTLMSYPNAKGARDNLQAEVFQDMEATFPNLKLERTAVVYNPEDICKENDFLIPDNLPDTLVALLYVLTQKNCKVTLNDKSYKVNAKFADEEEEISFQARLFKNDDATSYVRFEKTDGNLMKYHELTQSLEKELDNVTKIPV